MAALYLLAGVNHFISPDFYAKMIPDYIPYSRFLVYLSGVIEIILAIGVVLPKTKKIAAWGIVFMLIAVFPANLNMALNASDWDISKISLYSRLPFQLFLIFWAWIYTRDENREQKHITWKTKLVLLFAKIRKPIDLENDIDISQLRAKSERASKLGFALFDSKVSVAETIDEYAGEIPIRIYKNSENKNQKVILYYHGGGFVLYGLNSHDNVCRRLCSMNDCIVVSVDYRLAPEHTFPKAHDDAFHAIEWTIKNIGKFGGNPSAIILAGDSAGGNLAACMAHKCKKENIKLKAQILIYPWIDGKLDNPSIHRNGKGFMLEKETMFWFQQQYTPDKKDHCNPLVSPCYETDFSGLAPAFIITAQFDPLLDDGFKYYNQLLQAANKVKYKEYKGLIHGFFNIPQISTAGMRTYYDIKAFVGTV
jgi:acetyl esterase